MIGRSDRDPCTCKIRGRGREIEQVSGRWREISQGDHSPVPTEGSVFGSDRVIRVPGTGRGTSPSTDRETGVPGTGTETRVPAIPTEETTIPGTDRERSAAVPTAPGKGR